MAHMKDVGVVRSDMSRLQQFWNENSVCLKVQVNEATLGACTGLECYWWIRTDMFSFGFGDFNNFLDRVFKSLSAHQWWMYRNGTKPFCSCDVSQLCVVWRLLGDSVSLPACCSFGAPLHVSSVICSPLWEVLGRKAEEQACTKWEGRRQKVIYMWKAFVPKRKNLPC